MALDMAKYRTLFLEEAAEYLAEIGSAMLALEKDLEAADSIDVIFRMAHSIKSMAASLEYDAITELAHALEDRMESVRTAGRVESGSEMRSLFQGLEGLEAMVRVVREMGESPPSQPELVAAVRGVEDPPGAAPAGFSSDPVLAAGESTPGSSSENPLKKKALR